MDIFPHKLAIKSHLSRCLISSGQGLEEELPYLVELLKVKVSMDNIFFWKSFSDNLRKVKKAAKL
jgi:hypothetical protein